MLCLHCKSIRQIQRLKKDYNYYKYFDQNLINYPHLLPFKPISKPKKSLAFDSLSHLRFSLSLSPFLSLCFSLSFCSTTSIGKKKTPKLDTNKRYMRCSVSSFPFFFGLCDLYFFSGLTICLSVSFSLSLSLLHHRLPVEKN